MSRAAMPVAYQIAYIDAVIRQSTKWANGHPEHNYEFNECCADFSCCYPDLFDTDDERRRRIHADLVERLLARRRALLEEPEDD